MSTAPTGQSRVLAGKRTLITGASKGIGAGIARAFAAAGATLIITGRDLAGLTQQAHQLRHDHGVDITSLAVDLSAAEAPDRLAREALAAYDGLDVLINNTGISYPEHVADLSVDIWTRC